MKKWFYEKKKVLQWQGLTCKSSIGPKQDGVQEQLKDNFRNYLIKNVN